MTAPHAYSPDPLPDNAPPSPALIFAARCACGVLALAGLLAVCGSIVAGPRGLSGGGYVASLALQVATAVLFGFLAAYRPAPAHAVGFAGVALTAAAVQAATQTALLAATVTSPTLLTVLRVIVVALTIAAAALFALTRDRAAAHAVLLQLAHRGIALAIWLLIARLILAAWGRPIAWAAHLLPAAFALAAVAAFASLTVLYTSRTSPDRAPFGESRHLTRVSAVLLGLTLGGALLAALLPPR